jgi:hypothetical protein
VDERIRVRSTILVVRSPKSLQHKLFGEGWDRTRPRHHTAKLSIHGDFWQTALTNEAERLGIDREPSRYTPTMAVAPGWRVTAALSTLATASGVPLTGLTALDPGRRTRAAGLGTSRPSRTVKCRTGADDCAA